jgi:hypothetical protein
MIRNRARCFVERSAHSSPALFKMIRSKTDHGSKVRMNCER